MNKYDFINLLFSINNIMSFKNDTLQLEALYNNVIETRTLQQENLGAYVKAGALGAILGLLTNLVTYTPGSGERRHVHNSQADHKSTIQGVRDIIGMCQDMVYCLNRRAGNTGLPSDRKSMEQIKDINFLYNDILSNTQNLSQEQVDNTIQQLKDIAVANELEDEPRMIHWGL